MSYQKYNISSDIIPQESRKEINEKILYLIDNRKCEEFGIDKETIFNSYSGDGGLHGLQFKNYNSFYAFTEAKKEIENGQFYTSHNTCKFCVDMIKPNSKDIIMDITSGLGNFFNYCPVEENIYSNEIDLKSYKVQRYLYPNINMYNEDVRFFNPQVKADIIFSNPPYNLKFIVDKKEILSQLYCCFKAYDLLKAGGLMLLIIPNSFMNDEFIDSGTIKEMNNRFNFIFQFDLSSNAFKHVGVENFDTKIMVFQKISEHIKKVPYNTNKITVNEFTESEADIIYKNYIRTITELKEGIKAKLYYENVNHKYNEKDIEFNFKVQKLLFDIKRNPKLSKYISRAEQYYNSYFTQKKPENLDWKQWEEIRITKKKVIKYLKDILRKQNMIEKDITRVVKTSYGLKIKGYSESTQQYISRLNNSYSSFNDMILNNNYTFEDRNYYRLYQKKLKQYKNQSQDFNNMQEDKSIKNWLDNLSIYNYESDEELRLNDVQKNIVNKMLQKKYGYMQASQGSGKTLMSITYGLYRQQTTSIKNIFCVAPSIAINGTWESTLTAYKIPFITLKSFADIEKVKHGDFVLITFNMLIKLQKRVKKHLKQIGYNYLLLVDEADSIARIESKRTKATLGTFNKAKFKLLLSGTMTRNNITESFTQFNLLYGSSINFLSENEYIFEEDKDTKELKEITNNNYMKPFQQYKKGHESFRNSFNPIKITVFGVGQNTQDIYNADILKKLINKTIITKTFEEVTGRKIYEIVQHTVRFNNNEKDLYYKAINEFYNMKYLFTSTGNPRKDRMMEIIQQIQLLLNICQHPQTYKEYGSLDIPNKYKKVMSMLMNWSNETVAIGCRTIKEVECYSALIRRQFPNRPLFIVTGNTTTMKKRKEIVKAIKQTENGILLSTQQSLSSSISIEFINKVICTALSWNWSTLSQYFFRFIRYNSKDNKEVHFITYENSLESNLLGLLMAKENLTMFMKNQELEDNEELYEKFGITFNLIDMLLTKDTDSEGKRFIRWGEQNIM
jgi:hypothetical protein